MTDKNDGRARSCRRTNRVLTVCKFLNPKHRNTRCFIPACAQVGRLSPLYTLILDIFRIRVGYREAMLNLLNLFSLKHSPLLSQFHILLFYVLLFHVLHFHVLQFHALHIDPSISRPSFSRPAFSAPPQGPACSKAIQKFRLVTLQTSEPLP